MRQGKGLQSKGVSLIMEVHNRRDLTIVLSLRAVLSFLKTYIVAVIAVRIHLFPFRTEKLSSPSPMVLPHQVGE